MKELCRTGHSVGTAPWVYTNNICKEISHPFSELDIIDLSDDFLTPGIHFVHAQNVESGREFISIFLSTLKYYSHVGCLTTNQALLKFEGVLDILHEVGHFSIKSTALEEYFATSFVCDFIWIELDGQLENTPFYRQFLYYVTEFGIDKNIPIFIITYP